MFNILISKVIELKTYKKFKTNLINVITLD